MKDGFHQIKLDEKFSEWCTFNSPFGCFKFLKAPFGIASIPEIFQKLTMKYFADIPGVTVYFDDILCAAESLEELNTSIIVEQVINRAGKYNIKFNPEKLQYFVNEVKYFSLKFNLSMIISPFRELLKNNVGWSWSENNEKLLSNIKDIINRSVAVQP